MAILINGVRQLYKPKIITYPDTTLFGEPSLIKFKDSNEAIHYLKGYYNGNFEYETMQYLSLPDVSLTQAQQAALDANIKAIKYGSGIVLSSLTAKPSLASGYYFVTQSSVDLRPYALISGVQFSFSDGSKTAVYSGTMTQGTGETLGDELITNGNMETGDPPTSWLANGGATISSAADERTGGVGSSSLNGIGSSGTGVSYQSLTLSNGLLYKLIGWTKNYDTAGTNLILGVVSGNSNTSNNWEQTTLYYAATGNTFLHCRVMNTSRQGRFDDISLKQVLTPSTSDFLSSALTVESGFNPNVASFTVTITRT